MADWPAGCDPYWSDQMGVPGKVCLNSVGKFIDIPTGIVAPSAREASSVAAHIVTLFGGKNTLKPAESFDPLKWLGEGNNTLFVGAIVLAFMLLLLLAGKAKR